MKRLICLPELFITSFSYRIFLCFLIYTVFSMPAFSQCPGGYITSRLDWDNRGYIHKSFLSGAYITDALVKPQYFMMGKATRLSINSTHPSNNDLTANGIRGADTLHTGEALSYGTRKDLHYKFDGTITINFETAVRNVKFSVYDIDYNQTVTVTSTNGATAVPITMTKISGTNLTITPAVMPANTVVAKAGATTAIALTSSDGTANVSITGPLTSITIAMTTTGTKTSGSAASQEDGSSWLSDIEACVLDTPFPTSFHAPYTQPFTGQPAYFLAAHNYDSAVYMINSATGVADLLFVDPFLGEPTISSVNSLTYDPVNKIVYYVRSNSSITGTGYKTVMKYDATTETISTFIPDLNVLGIPVGGQGISGASAAFYDGALYLGIEVFEGCNCPDVAGVWRIDIDGSLNPVKASMVFAKPNGDYYSTEMFNWGDITIKDGILYSLSQYSTNSVSGVSMLHFNLLTGAETEYRTYSSFTGGQLGQTWNGKIFKVWNSIWEYNGAGGWPTNIPIGSNSCSPVFDTTFEGSATDASDPFKPKCDFGDAPASYDPVALSPAVNQKHCNNALLRLGTAWDREWSKNPPFDATGDATDEDGITTVTILNSNNIVYNHVQRVTVTNNTGATATLAGWLDYNFDGDFDFGEGRVVSVPSTGSGTQNINLSWLGLQIPNSSPNTYLRIRLVSGSTAMTAANATGWYDDGEVEDYPVVTASVALSINLLDFNALITKDKKAELKWSATNDNEANGFEIQRSQNQNDWVKIGWKDASNSNAITNYSFIDNLPQEGNNYYRLRLIEKNGSSKFSPIKNVNISVVKNEITLAPNPTKNNGVLLYTGNSNSTGVLKIKSLSGQTLISKSVIIRYGENRIPLEVSSLNPGIYIVELVTKEKTYTNKLSVNR